jgi:hypothetical protein
VVTALSLIPGIGPVLDGIFETLKGSGVIRTPEDELKVQQALAQVDADKLRAYTEFIRATTPASADTPRWINGFIAITRPAMVWVVTGSIVAAFFISGVADRVTATLNAFGQAGTAGLMFLSIPVLWITGRTVEKWTALKTGQNGGNSETVPLPAKPTREPR